MDDNGLNEFQFYKEVDSFYETAIDYIEKWTLDIKKLKHFQWILLKKSPTWKEIETSFGNVKVVVKVNESALFDEMLKINEYTTEDKLRQWNSETISSDKRWTEIFMHMQTTNVPVDNIFKWLNMH